MISKEDAVRLAKASGITVRGAGRFWPAVSADELLMFALLIEREIISCQVDKWFAQGYRAATLDAAQRRGRK